MKQSKLFLITITFLFSLLTSCSKSGGDFEVNSASKAAQIFLTRWYLQDIRGLPTLEALDAMNSNLDYNLKVEFETAIKKVNELKNSSSISSGPIPWSEGDFITGIWEAPSYFYVSDTQLEEGVVKVMFDYYYEDTENNNNKKLITVLLVEKKEGWRVLNIVSNEYNMLEEIKKVYDTITPVNGVSPR